MTPGSTGFVGQKVVDEADKVIRSRPFIVQEWEHICISQNILNWISPIQYENYLKVGMEHQNCRQELRRVAKFVLDTKNLGLHIVPTMYDGIWHLEVLSDSDFANDKETIHCNLLWSTYCMEKQEYGKCGFIIH